MLFDYDVIIGLVALFLIRFKRKSMREWGMMIGISFLFMQGVARAAYIPSGSMEPTLQVDDRILIDVFSARIHGPERADVVILRSPEDGKMLCKRVVGIAGDVLEVKDGSLWRNGQRLEEHYLSEPTLGTFGPFTVPAGRFFVMGDHRNNSHDSRVYGSVPNSLLAGTARAVFWPPSHLSGL